MKYNTRVIEFKTYLSQKPDSAATKELCILTLTKIYRLTSQNQTLVREVATPTLPTFLTSCLNLIVLKSSAKRGDAPSSLIEVAFCAFATLLPHYPTLYRPEVNRIRQAVRPYLAPTSSDAFVPLSLQESARRLVVLLHLTTVKNAGGEEWGKAVRSIIQHIHVTSDRVFRAVVEDWESTVGYIGEAVDFNQDLTGGSNAADDFPPWVGIYAGADRLVGLLAMLEEYVKGETFAPVSIPLAAIMDMTTRMLSVAMPSSSDPSGGVRPHPAVDRDERDALWSSLPHVHIAAMQIIEAIANRLQEGFAPLAAGALDQLTWIFPSGRNDLAFHRKSYNLARKILLLIGNSLNKRQASKLVPIIRSCCRDLMGENPYSPSAGVPSGGIAKVSPHVQNLNGKMSMQIGTVLLEDTNTHNTVAAKELLPLLISHLPQKHLDIPIRSLIERTAILTHDSDAMLACIMTPFIGKDGRAISGIMPYATRESSHDNMVELLLRPRMPSLPARLDHPLAMEATVLEPDDDDMGMYQETSEGQYEVQGAADMQGFSTPRENDQGIPPASHGLGHTRSSPPPLPRHSGVSFNTADPNIPVVPSHSLPDSRQIGTAGAAQATQLRSNSPRRMDHDDINMGEELSDSSDESVHLTMELDSDSE